VILGILATIVVPQFSNAAVNAKENTLKDELRYLRTQIVVYKAQHHDVPPGYPNGDRTASATGPDFIAQLTKPTDEDGVTNPVNTPAFKFGPYLSAMPTNPLNNLTAVLIVDDTAAIPDPTNIDYGWIYKPLTGEIVANSTGSDASGTAYKNY
jgi:type II secretory pathway pseudopilin PulG